MKRLIIIAMSILFGIQNLCCQDRITKIVFDFTFDEDNNYFGYDKLTDTTKNYILFGNDYINDLIKVYIDDTIYYEKRLTTNPLYGASDIIEIPSKGRVEISINSLSKICLYRYPRKNYLYLNYLRSEEKLMIWYSKFCPSIY